MIPSLYKPFKKWADTGSIYILSDLHFDDADCRLMDRNWISPHMQIERINSVVGKNDTFVCLGDVGKAEYVSSIKAGLKKSYCWGITTRKEIIWTTLMRFMRDLFLFRKRFYYRMSRFMGCRGV